MFLIQLTAPSEWELFFGHFHPVVVHLPIGMLLIAFILELLALKTKSQQFDSAVSIILFWGFINAVISCTFGWFLSLSGEYNEGTLFWHQWMGIGVAAIAGILWLIKKRSLTKNAFKLAKPYSVLLALLVIMLTLTGHLGGNMTHGEDYLTANTPQPFRSWLGIAEAQAESTPKKITNINEAIIYTDLVAPVLKTKCWNCHNATKIKGGLRMDTEELLMKGGKHGVVIKARNAERSELIRRVLLPEGDDERMPPKGKPGLSEQEIALIKWWIASGSSFKAKVKEVKQTEGVAAYFKSFSNGDAATSLADANSGKSSESQVFSQKIAKADNAAISALQKENILIHPVAQNQSFLEVSAVNAPEFNDEKVKMLTKIATQIVWLKLAKTKISDNGVSKLSECKNMVKLNLENTGITNKSIDAIRKLPNLEYLNITHTKIDDKGLMALTNLKSLKRVYCWQSGVTETGALEFEKVNKGVKCVFR